MFFNIKFVSSSFYLLKSNTHRVFTSQRLFFWRSNKLFNTFYVFLLGFQNAKGSYFYKLLASRFFTFFFCFPLLFFIQKKIPVQWQFKSFLSKNRLYLTSLSFLSKYTRLPVLRSPFIYKKSFEHLEYAMHTSSFSSTFKGGLRFLAVLTQSLLLPLVQQRDNNSMPAIRRLHSLDFYSVY